ncbi:MAG: PKD domain-containing protein [Bacteroidota bacterium]
MLKRSLILLLSGLFYSHSFCQTVIWTEAFQNACVSDCAANGSNTGNGAWTSTATGANGTESNIWYVSGAECGNNAAACGSVCGATDPSLHIGSNPGIFGDQGASYLAGGGGFFDPISDVRIESPTINLTGQSTISVNFNYIENGDGTNDDATLWYFDGSAWSQINALAKTALTCNPQGTWTAFTAALPVSANNNANVKIGFRWVNNDDNVGTDPSFAVDDITITVPALPSAPVANFTASQTTICVGDCITFTNTSTFAAPATFAWDFGNTQISNQQNPTAICYSSPGTFNVSLVVTDINGNDTEIKNAFITVIAPETAGVNNSGNVCNNSTINLNTLLSGASPGGVWLETTSSGQFNATTGLFDANGLTPATYSFNYTVNSTNPCADQFATISVQVFDCGILPLNAVISASNGTVCIGQSLSFTSNSTGNIVGYQWSFGGGSPGTAITQGPHFVSFAAAGNYNVILEVTDNLGNTDDTTITIQVTPCSSPIAAFNGSDDDPCLGECVTFNNNSTSIGVTTYSWTFNGGTPATSTAQNPGPVCYNTEGNFTAVLVVTNPFGNSSFTQNITVNPLPIVTAFSDQTINLLQSATINATSNIGQLTWDWNPSAQGNILDCTVSDCSEAIVTPVITTDFIATATSLDGCQNSDTVTITIDLPAGGYAIGVPNAFSPNDDNQNDILLVDGVGITAFHLRVFNRYGQMVFESEDQSIGWDGNFNQKPLNPAVFAYTLEYTLIDGQSGVKNGNVTLLK